MMTMTKGDDDDDDDDDDDEDDDDDDDDDATDLREENDKPDCGAAQAADIGRDAKKLCKFRIATDF